MRIARFGVSPAGSPLAWYVNGKRIMPEPVLETEFRGRSFMTDRTGTITIAVRDELMDWS